MELGDVDKAFRTFINDEGQMFSYDIPIYCLDGDGLKSDHPLKLKYQ